MGSKIRQQLEEVGSKLLESASSTKDSIIKLLKQGATFLSELDQTPPKAVLDSMQLFQKAIVKPELLKHQDREVNLLVATCICEITRITAPEVPYSDDILKDIFQLIVSTFNGLSDTSSPHFGRRVLILETLARYRSCVVMLDLECDYLVNAIFRTFFAVARDEHSESVTTSMQTIMMVLLEESEDVREDLLVILLSVLGRKKNELTKTARRLAINIIEKCAAKLEPFIKRFLISSMSGDSKSLKFQIDHHEVIYDIYRCVPHILLGVIPYMTGELLTDELDARLKAVRLVGDLFALPDCNIPGSFEPLFSEFLKRLSDKETEVRLAVLQCIKACLLLNPTRTETPHIIVALKDRLLDYDENVRRQVVAVICDVACQFPTAIPVDTIKLVAERLRDKSLLVKKYTMERIADIYRIHCLKCPEGLKGSEEYFFIPRRILRCFYDKDFRSDTVEAILCLSLFPSEFSVKDKVINWIKVFSEFDKVEVKALEKILEQKKRLQQEMQRYLSIKQTNQSNNTTDIQKKVTFSFRNMSRCFTDSTQAEESLNILDQLKDADVWKILTSLLHPSTTCFQASNYRDDLLRILGEKHHLYEFLGMLSIKCSYLLFNKEHVKEILLVTEHQKSTGNSQSLLACMNILVILARFSPLLLSGIEEDLIRLLEDENEIIKEGILHVLAIAGGAIREQLGVSTRSLDLVLERICLEGNRRQAKYAVYALASITTDDGLMSLSVLYKRLVDMLLEKSHLPAVLQCLGCIAETAMPVFETRENEIEGFIKKNILECGQTAQHIENTSWDERSEICSLKIFGIKTMVNSFLPIKDAHLRMGIDDLIGILKNILLFGDISINNKSSSVDSAHLRLSAAKSILRLSKHWDHKIPIDVFYLTLQISEPGFPEVKKLLLNKVYQYIKDRRLDPKYSCTFFLDLSAHQHNPEETKNNLSEIIQVCEQMKLLQSSAPTDVYTPALYPEYILPYIIHGLANHSTFPNIDECRDVKAFESMYRQLHFFLSMVLHVDEESKPEAITKINKETLSVINSIFRSIKQSEDAFDGAKTKNSYGMCELGLSVIKCLAPNNDDLLDIRESLCLPPMLYKPKERKEGDEQTIEGWSWLADAKILAHFESLKFESNATIAHEIVGDDMDSETEENDFPLKKMIKRLKAKGVKSRKKISNEASLALAGNESDLDILKMVREINCHGMELNSMFESSNGDSRKSKNDNEAEKCKRVTNELDSVSVPKRKRSSSAEALKFSSRKGSRTPKKNADLGDVALSESIKRDEDMSSSSDGQSLQEDRSGPSESDLLLSCMKKSPSMSSKLRRNTDKDSATPKFTICWEKDTKVIVSGDTVEKNPEKTIDGKRTQQISDSKTEFIKKQERRSLPGLAKCTSRSGVAPTEDLIGCRIKVWWPVDKKFYEGVVKSFDNQKKKHVVLYDDGDVEVLQLERERWELVLKGKKPGKEPTTLKSPRSSGKSAEQKKSFTGLRKKENTSEISPPSPAKRKRTPRKNLKRGKNWISESKGVTMRRKIWEQQAMSSDDDLCSGHKLNNDRVKRGANEEGNINGGVEEQDVDNDNSDVMESEELLTESRCDEDIKGSHDFHGSDEVSSSDHKSDLEATSADSGEDKSIELDSPGSPGVNNDEANISKNDGSSFSSESADADLSDDEPLSTWKHRVKKSN
ncbi:chromatin/chromatin-binding, or -regulatory protein [Lithospermum erythrorhizon]|uniref:Chromatin/chromatin-binding, or -regulatory protein n=1 Tax=Lithospermum erythrorhizon TaxID=34254 RepID=A0AAV3PP83_LITER